MHGAALGPDEVIAARKELAWPHPAFEIPEQHYQAWDAKSRGAELEAEWQQRFDAYAENYPELAAEYHRRVAGEYRLTFPRRPMLISPNVRRKVRVSQAEKPRKTVLMHWTDVARYRWFSRFGGF